MRPEIALFYLLPGNPVLLQSLPVRIVQKKRLEVIIIFANFASGLFPSSNSSQSAFNTSAFIVRKKPVQPGSSLSLPLMRGCLGILVISIGISASISATSCRSTISMVLATSIFSFEYSLKSQVITARCHACSASFSRLPPCQMGLPKNIFLLIKRQNKNVSASQNLSVSTLSLFPVCLPVSSRFLSA